MHILEKVILLICLLFRFSLSAHFQPAVSKTFHTFTNMKTKSRQKKVCNLPNNTESL